MSMPVEPPPSRWDLPDPPPSSPDEPGGDVIAVGGDLEPGTILDAYRRGLFPMRADGMLAWWSPDPRGVIPLDGFHVSRSLRPALARFEIRLDTSFESVTRACADPRRAHGWVGAPHGRSRAGGRSRMSDDITIFHNQACSKSRGALEILEERGVSHDVVRYLETPPDRATIERILDAIPDEPQALVRTDDDKFKQ